MEEEDLTVMKKEDQATVEEGEEASQDIQGEMEVRMEEMGSSLHSVAMEARVVEWT